MKIGFNMLLWSSNIGEEHFPLLKTMKDVGYDGVEFFLGEPDLNHHKKVGAELKTLGLGCTTVTCPPPSGRAWTAFWSRLSTTWRSLSPSTARTRPYPNF